MDPLKDFIDNNRPLFESETPSIGAEDRMWERLRQQQEAATSQPVQIKGRRKWLVYTSVAASIAVLIGVGSFFMSQPAAVSPCADEAYTCYLVEIQKLSGEIERSAQDLNESRRQEILQTLSAVAPQDDDFSETLPQELSQKELDALLLSYYESMYEGVKEVAALAFQ